MQMPFGKWRGWDLCDIETPYLEWLTTIKLKALLNRAVKEELDRRYNNFEPDPPPDPPEQFAGTTQVASIARDWYRDMAKEFHPDRGGSVEAMRAINRANEHLRSLLGLP